MRLRDSTRLTKDPERLRERLPVLGDDELVGEGEVRRAVVVNEGGRALVRASRHHAARS